MVERPMRCQRIEWVVHHPEAVRPVVSSSARIGETFQYRLDLERGLHFADDHTPLRIEMSTSPASNVVDKVHRLSGTIKRPGESRNMNLEGLKVSLCE
jgi:hypothetical protein